MKLFFDTETTGLPSYNKPLNDISQPHICQLGMLVTNDEGASISQVDVLVKPEGRFVITPQLTAIHGIDMAMCEKDGLPIRDILDTFEKTAFHCDTWVAHNLKFDRMLLDIQFARNNMILPSPLAHECTMLASQSIIRLKGKYGYKWPKLSEAYEYYFKKPLENAHNAIHDVIACKDVYFEMKRLGQL